MSLPPVLVSGGRLVGSAEPYPGVPQALPHVLVALGSPGSPGRMASRTDHCGSLLEELFRLHGGCVWGHFVPGTW